MFNSKPLDLSVKRMKLVSENNIITCKDDKLTKKSKCKLTKTQDCLIPRKIEDKKTLTENKINSVSVKELEIVKESAIREKNHNWKILGNAYFHHVFISVSLEFKTVFIFISLNITSELFPYKFYIIIN